MGVSGTLKSMSPGDLLQWLSLGQKTGTLLLRNKVVEKKIFFRNGRVISSASNDPREYLGQFLMSHGFITEQELMKAMEVQQQSGILLGKILVMIDVINETDLHRLMRLKAEEEIYDIFLWREGEFQFVDDELPTMEMIPLQVDVTGIIMEGTRRVDEWQRIREIIPNETLIPSIVKSIPADTLELDEVHLTIIAAIDGRRSLAELVPETRSSSFTVSSTVHSLVREGYIQLMDPASQRPASVPAMAAGRITSEIAAVVDNEDDEIASLLNRAQAALRTREYEKTQRFLKAAENLDPNHPKVRSAVRGAEAAILSDLRAQGIIDARIPRVAKPLEEITSMNFTPNEGFMLSRINGQWNIGSLIKISPIREPDAMLIFYRLWKDGIIRLE
jgi:hypothetical protein